jgi:hypothetical protein
MKGHAAQQIVRRERRERVSQLVRCGEGSFDSRRRVNSTVGLLVVQNRERFYERAVKKKVLLSRPPSNEGRPAPETHPKLRKSDYTPL